MNLVLPAFLVAGGLIALPIVLHLLRRSPRDLVPFPTLRFLGPFAIRDTRRQTLRRWLTLLARCAIILLVAGAFSRPYWPQPDEKGNAAVIVLVDNSYSMQSAGRRKGVDDWLDQQLASLRPGDRLGVLQLQPTPKWLAPLNDDLAAGRAAMKSREDGYESSHYAAGLALAAAVLDETPATRRKILIAGDEQNLAWSDVDFKHRLPPGVELLAAPAAPLPGTQATIFNFHASRSPGGRLVLAATVRLYLPEKLQRSVSFYAGNQLLGKLDVELTAGELHLVQADYPAPTGTGDLALRATIEPDDLPADDTAYTVLPPNDSRKVLLAAEAGTEVDFLARALASVHGGDLPELAISPPPATMWPTGSVAVVRGSAPFRGAGVAALDKFLESGGAAWILCDGSTDQIEWLSRHGVKVTPSKLEPDGQVTHLRDFDVDHPLFAPFAGRSLAPLLEAQFRIGWSLAGEDVEPLARWSDHTVAVTEVRVGAGRLLITGFDDRRATANWPLQSSFVPFAHHAIVWLGDSATALSQAGLVSQHLNVPGPGLWKSVDSPRVSEARKVTGAVSADAPGIYAYQANNETRLFAINLDPQESDLSPLPSTSDMNKLISSEPRSPAQEVAASAILPDDHKSQIWWWLMSAAAIVLGLELILANRTLP